jgi:hypothetical protein
MDDERWRMDDSAEGVDRLISWPVGQRDNLRLGGLVEQKLNSLRVAGGGLGWQVAGFW